MDAENYDLKQRTFANMYRLSLAVLGIAITFPIAAYILLADVPYIRVVAMVILFPCFTYFGLVVVATFGYVAVDLNGIDFKNGQHGFARNMPLLKRFILAEAIR